MESPKDNELGSKPPIIFGLISGYQVQDTLEKNGAKTKETKAVFLIRDSSTYPGLTTVSFYSQEHDTVKHMRFGLTKEGWKIAPKPPKEPKMTDTLEVKEKYKHVKEKFDAEMDSFINTAKVLFEQNVTLEEIKSLSEELQKNEFNLNGLIKPSREQATQEKHFTDYIGDAFVSDEKSNSNAHKYLEW